MQRRSLVLPLPQDRKKQNMRSDRNSTPNPAVISI
jgi:hypothetical protein